ncbi:MAG: hypothetical protein ABH950_06940 [Candidatus Altiarchaeota archaeon]
MKSIKLLVLAVFCMCFIFSVSAAADCREVNLVLSTPEPEPDTYIGITLKDNLSNAILVSETVKIYDVQTTTGVNTVTNSNGWFRFRPSKTGAYRLIFTQSNRWCPVEFSVKKRMREVGSGRDIFWPEKNTYEVGQDIIFSVPSGVGVKVLNAEGGLWRNLEVSRAGYANITFYDPGMYTIVVAEVSSEYWGRNRSIKIIPSKSPPTSTSTPPTTSTSSTSSTSTIEVAFTTSSLDLNASLVNESVLATEDSESDSGSDYWFKMALFSVVLFLFALVLFALGFAHKAYRNVTPSKKKVKTKKKSAMVEEKEPGNGNRRGNYRRYRSKH